MPNQNHAPAGYRSVTPYFTVTDANRLIQFLELVFHAEVLNRSTNGVGAVVHSEVRLGDTIVELSDANDRFGPRTNTLHIFVGDTDACYERALKAGAASLYEPADMPYGERSAGIADPFGNHWYIATFTREGGYAET